MKKSFLLFLSIGILFTSCENQLDNLPVEEIGQELKTKVVVKFNTTKALDVEEASNVFDVSIEELKTYMANQTIMSIPVSNPNARTISQETIEPIVSGTDTVMYLVNYPEGWCLFSGDKRTPAILAYSETGSLSMNDINTHPGLSVWVDDKIDRIGVLKGTIEYNEESLYLRDWAQYDSNITNVSSVSNSDEELTWVYIGNEEVSRVEKTDAIQLETAWGQGIPWNKYVPYKENSTTERCPAGCVPIAVSQIIYYYHFHGFPQVMPSSGYSVGDCNNDIYSFSSMTSSVFNTMAKTETYGANTNETALMIGYIGRQLDTEYEDTNSTASMSSATQYLCNLGINHDLHTYSGVTAFNMVSYWRKPTIVSAFTDSGVGHAWIMDGAKYTEHIYDEVYGYMNDSLYFDTGIIPAGTEFKRIRKTEILDMKTSFNWGAPGLFNYTNYFDVSDDWNVGFNVYKYNKQMIIYRLI